MDTIGRRAMGHLGGRIQCTAKNRQGEQCGKVAIPGGFVCVMHGGNYPQTRDAAKRRLAAASVLAVDVLVDALVDPTIDRALAIRAAQLVLDRVGFAPSAQLNITMSEEVVTLNPDTSTQQMLDEIAALGRLLIAAETQETDIEAPKPDFRALLTAPRSVPQEDVNGDEVDQQDEEV